MQTRGGSQVVAGPLQVHQRLQPGSAPAPGQHACRPGAPGRERSRGSGGTPGSWSARGSVRLVSQPPPGPSERLVAHDASKTGGLTGHPGVGDGMARVGCPLTVACHARPHGLHHIGPGGAEDRSASATQVWTGDDRATAWGRSRGSYRPPTRRTPPAPHGQCPRHCARGHPDRHPDETRMIERPVSCGGSASEKVCVAGTKTSSTRKS